MKYLIKAIEEIAQENQEGFTIKLPSLEYVTSGFIVAFKETQNCFNKEGLEKALKHALQNGKILGGWYNRENNLYYFDSSKVFKDKDKAIRFGLENEQIAIFDLDNLKEIRL